MKKNAILIGSILFVAGCASNQSGYQTSTTRDTFPSSDVAVTRSTEMVARNPQGEMIPPSDPSLASQYDPAMGGFSAGVSGSASSSYPNRTSNLSVNDYHADSSVAGGSNEARGYSGRYLPTEGAAHPMNPAVQADSSIRGGSRMARETQLSDSLEASSGSTYRSTLKADSSIRGGSNEARFGNPGVKTDSNPDHWSSSDQGFEYLKSEREALGQTRTDAWASDKSNDSLQGSANWNPGDDLLRDGTQTAQDDLDSPLVQDSSGSVGAAATSQSETALQSPLDGIDSSSQANSDHSKADSLASPGSYKDLNSSPNLERDIAGTYDISKRATSSTTSPSQDTQPGLTGVANGVAVGGPGSTETGAASSSAAVDDLSSNSQLGHSLFQNNRAQGVGSAATGEIGAVENQQLNAGFQDDNSLAQQVKATLTRETTGTEGITSRDVARNVQVSTRGGVVMLKGTVPSQKQKDLLEIRAREIKGVSRVDNQLTISPQSEPAVRDLNLGRNLEDTTDQLKDIRHGQE